MTQLWESLKIALLNLKHNKGRSALTMLGIIIGISSVVMIISIGNCVRNKINMELDNIGSGQVNLYLDGQKQKTAIAFIATDVDYMKERIPDLKGATIFNNGRGIAAGPRGTIEAHVTGGMADLQYISGDPIIRGSYFTESDYLNANRVCVLTETGAKAMFGNTDVVGMSFDLTLYGITQELMIVGIRQDSASMFVNMGMGDYQYTDIQLPATVMAANFEYQLDYFYDILLIANSTNVSMDVARKAVKLLESKYNIRGESQILVRSFADAREKYNTILNTISLFVSMVAAISFLVGGIGVTNIMLVSVTERTREIGIRKALGARTSSILIQFLAEASMITLTGGMIGIVSGYLGAVLVCGLAGLAPEIEAVTVLLITIFSSAIGIFCGIYPARKAAQLSPIAALRHEK